MNYSNAARFESTVSVRRNILYCCKLVQLFLVWLIAQIVKCQKHALEKKRQRVVWPISVWPISVWPISVWPTDTWPTGRYVGRAFASAGWTIFSFCTLLGRPNVCRPSGFWLKDVEPKILNKLPIFYAHFYGQIV
jgi:hypothetical protein